MLELNKLSVKYKGEKEFAIKDITLKEREGLIIFVGRTGSGKSTLARTISGMIPWIYPAEVTGLISVYGVNPVEDGPQSLAGILGYMSQATEMFSFTSTVLEEVSMPALNITGDAEEAKSRAVSIMEKFGILKLANKRLCDLSSGQKQLVMIASVLVTRPRVVVFDEPLARLDKKSSELVAKVLKELSDNMLVLVFEHHLDEIIGYADNMYVLEKSIIAHGKPRDLIEYIMNIDPPVILEYFIRGGCKLDNAPLNIDEVKRYVGSKLGGCVV